MIPSKLVNTNKTQTLLKIMKDILYILTSSCVHIQAYSMYGIYLLTLKFFISSSISIREVIIPSCSNGRLQ